jgi:hypothetical protein
MRCKKLLLISAITILSLSFILAAHIIRTSTGTTSYSVDETIQNTYNISVNNTVGGTNESITSVNVTIPSSFTFTAATNGTNAVGETTFVNTTTLLSWTNTTGYVINGSEERFFWFNATASYGDYNITVNVTNTTGSYAYYISVQVNDTTDPVASAGCVPQTVRVGATTTCSCTGTDTGGSGISTTTNSSTPSTSTQGTFTYSCIATDVAGNSNSTSTTYIVITDNVDAGGSSSSGTTTFWTAGTYVVPDAELEQPFSKELSEKQRLKIKINSQDHYIGIIDLTTTTATINISSTPQQTTLTTGDEKKFDTNEDNYYDILVKLNSIENNKANITIQTINEMITSETTESTQQQQETSTGTEDEPTKEPLPLGTIITIIIILLIIGIIYFKSKNRLKNNP